jgi:hypothetical protein
MVVIQQSCGVPRGTSPSGDDNREDGRGNLPRSATSKGKTQAFQENKAFTFTEAELKAPKKKEPTQWIVSRHHLVPRKVVVRSLEILDAKDAPDRPGMMFETTLQEMVNRFETVFGTSSGSRRSETRDDRVENVLDHLRRHTRRRRGAAVLQEGFIEWEQTSRVYELFCTNLNFFERIFFTVDVGESSSILSKVCSFFLIFMIILSIVTWMVSTLPSVQSIEASCTSTKPGDCAPEPREIFKFIEAVCVITFTLEYFIRLCTVHSVRFALLNEHFIEAVLTGSNLKQTQNRRSEHQSEDEQPRSIEGSKVTDAEIARHPHKLDGKLKTTFVHVTSGSNVIDLLAILPFWLEVFKLQGGGGFLVVLRILRLTRVFRVFKLGKYNDVFTLFARVIQQSTPALLLMIFFIVIGCCLFGTIMWFAEQGTWYPEGNPTLAPLGIVGRGAWLRHTGSKDEDAWEESPFQSIIHSFWYVIVTITTVGYGDVFPTSGAGKFVASTAILNGIIVLAMPIGVVGANFGTEYYRVVEDKKRRQRLKQQLDTQAVLECREDAAVENETAGGDILEASEAIGEGATELLRVDVARSRILCEAELLDQSWQKVLPELVHDKLSGSLRFFVVSFLGAHASSDGAPEQSGFSSKPKIQMTRLLDLDALTTQVSKAIQTVTSGDELAEFGLKEALECRQKWNKFTDSCWEYATKMCIMEKSKEPPEYWQMKGRLAAKVTTRGSVVAQPSPTVPFGQAEFQSKPGMGTIPEGPAPLSSVAEAASVVSDSSPGPGPPETMRDPPNDGGAVGEASLGSSA